MKHCIGGYYLVEAAHVKGWMDASLLPSPIWSTNDCICALHPAASALSWVHGKKERREYQNKLNLSKDKFKALQEKVDRLFNEEKIGWMSMFIELDTAIDFAKKYLQHIPNIKLLMIATTEKYRALFLEEEKPEGNQGEDGTYHSLKKKICVENRNGFRGYDIMGYENGGFHSFVCNSLEKDISEKLNIKLNENGLIEGYEDAEKANNYVSDPDIGAEPVSWMPWAIYDIPLR